MRVVSCWQLDRVGRAPTAIRHVVDAWRRWFGHARPRDLGQCDRRGRNWRVCGHATPRCRDVNGRAIRRGLASALLLTAFVVVRAPPAAHACKCAGPDMVVANPSLYDAAFAGTVTDGPAPNAPPRRTNTSDVRSRAGLPRCAARDHHRAGDGLGRDVPIHGHSRWCADGHGAGSARRAVDGSRVQYVPHRKFGSRSPHRARPSRRHHWQRVVTATRCAGPRDLGHRDRCGRHRRGVRRAQARSTRAAPGVPGNVTARRYAAFDDRTRWSRRLPIVDSRKRSTRRTRPLVSSECPRRRSPVGPRATRDGHPVAGS